MFDKGFGIILLYEITFIKPSGRLNSIGNSIFNIQVTKLKVYCTKSNSFPNQFYPKR
jgi:hypothetical protein